MKHAEFVSATCHFNTFSEPVAAPLFRKIFSVKAGECVTVTVSAAGFYDLYLNGRRVTRGYLAPGITDPAEVLYEDFYDLSDAVLPGKNTLCVLLGNGLRNDPGGQIWDFDRAVFRGAPAFALEAEIGQGGFTASDMVWTPSPILFDDYRTGVIYDARRELPGVFTDGDAGIWHGAVPAEGTFARPAPADAEPVGVRLLKSAAAVIPHSRVLTDGVDPKVVCPDHPVMDTSDFSDGFLYDFGTNGAGTLRLRISGERGQRVTVRVGEGRIGDDLSMHTLSYNALPFLQFFVYICRGDGVEEFEVPFVYYGGRYAHVHGITPEQARPDLLTFVELSSSFPDRVRFTCSDARVQGIYDMAVRSDRSCFLHFPNDCPQREKNGWTGDASESAEHLYLLYAPEKCLARWEREIIAAQSPEGQLPGIVPTGGWGFAWGNGPAWDRVLVNIPWNEYRFTGDLRSARAAYPALMKYLRYLESRLSPDGTLAIGLGDWCQPGRDAGIPTTPLAFTDTVVAMDIARKTERLGRAIGAPEEDVLFASAFAEDRRAAVRAAMLSPDGSLLCGGTQTAQSFGLYYGIFTEAERPAAFTRLVDAITQEDGFMNCGFLGDRVLFHVLGAGGRTDLALRMITRPEGPSYGYLLDHGFTTLAEDFTPSECTHGNPNSHNHHFRGDVTNFFIRYLTGLSVNEELTSPDSVRVYPVAHGLPDASVTRTMPHGTVTVDVKDGAVKIRKSGDVRVTLMGEILPAPDGRFVFAEE